MRLVTLPLLLLGALACAVRVDRQLVGANVAAGSHGDGVARSCDSLVVASYNIRYGEEIAQAIVDLRADALLASADILLLQEVDPVACERIADAFGLDYVYVPAARHPEHDRLFGNAVLVRGRVRAHGYVELPLRTFLALMPRVALWADVEVCGRSLRAISIHTSTALVSQEERFDQVRLAATELGQTELPLIFGGDFNSPSRDDVVALAQEMRELGLRRAFRRGEATARRDLRFRYVEHLDMELDHLFYRGLAARRSGVSQSALASDHFPIWTVFDWEPGG